MRRGWIVAAVMVVGGSALAGPAAPTPPAEDKPAEGVPVPAGAAVAPAAANTAELDAAAAELARALAGLRLPDAPAPYLAEARWVRADLLSLDGSYGGVITDVQERQAAGLAELRVGDRKFDNTNFFGDESGTARFAVGIEPSASYMRKQLWLALDNAFRGATRAYSQKQTTLERLQTKDVPDDYGAPPPAVVSVGPVVETPWDREGLSAMIGSLSARFEQAPAIDNGDVHLQILRSRESIVNTEGVRIERTHERAVLAVVADTKAADGMHLDHGLAVHLQSIPKADEEFLARGEALVDRVLLELGELAAAPVIEEEYDGPVLLMPLAAAQFLASTAATEALGTPAPWSDTGRVMDLEPAWQSRLGNNVLPPFIDLVDDPTLAGFGRYEIDAEGFVPKRVAMVAEGKMLELLMSRTPNAKRNGSNGHARMTPGLEVGPMISNLTLQSRRRGVAASVIERDLLRRAADDGYEFAYAIESLRDGTVLGPVPRESAEAYAGTGKLNLPLPGRVFRIEPGGKRTLVRGAVLAPMAMRVLRRIRAVGETSETVPMRLALGPFGGFGADVGMDGVLSNTVDAQVTAPALLIDGLEILTERGEHERQRTLVHPLRRGSEESRAQEKAAAGGD
jgi:TldD protein